VNVRDGKTRNTRAEMVTSPVHEPSIAESVTLAILSWIKRMVARQGAVGHSK
jgi:hypothetical protein